MIYKCKKKTQDIRHVSNYVFSKHLKKKTKSIKEPAFFLKILNKKAILIHKHFKGSLVYNKTIDL